MRERIMDFSFGLLLGVALAGAFNRMVPIKEPKASVVHGPVEFLLLTDAELSEDSPSSDVGIGEDLMTKETSGYCGCEAACCLEFSYDSNSGCHLCEALP